MIRLLPSVETVMLKRKPSFSSQTFLAQFGIVQLSVGCLKRVACAVSCQKERVSPEQPLQLDPPPAQCTEPPITSGKVLVEGRRGSSKGRKGGKTSFYGSGRSHRACFGAQFNVCGLRTTKTPHMGGLGFPRLQTQDHFFGWREITFLADALQENPRIYEHRTSSDIFKK